MFLNLDNKNKGLLRLKQAIFLFFLVVTLVNHGNMALASSGLAYEDLGYSPKDVAEGSVINDVWVWKMKDGKVIADTNNISDVETIASFKTTDYDEIILADGKTSIKKDGTVENFTVPSDASSYTKSKATLGLGTLVGDAQLKVGHDGNIHLITDSNYDTEGKYTYDIGNGQTEGVKPNLHEVTLNFAATDGNIALLQQALADIANGKDISQTILGTVDMGYFGLDDVTVKTVDGKAVFVSAGRKAVQIAENKAEFSIPSYNATTTSTNVSVGTSSTDVSIETPSSDSESSFITSNDIVVYTDSVSNNNDKSHILATAQLVNQCVVRCLGTKHTKAYCDQECNIPRCGCRDTDGNGVLETVCEAGQFGKKCLGVMSCDVRICDNPDLLKQPVWTAPANSDRTDVSDTPKTSATSIPADTTVYQGNCPPELCSSTFYPGGLLGLFKCPGTQYCNKYWCKGNCTASCGSGGRDPYGMCPDAGTVCCKPAALVNSSPTLAEMAIDSCPSTYCKPVCDPLKENDVGHKSCNGFECCMPNYNLGACSSLGGECVGSCEGSKVLGRDSTLCLQSGICCKKGTGSNLVSYCGCENGQPKCGAQMPNGLQCSTDSQCASLLNCH